MHALKVLEFGAIQQRLASHCETPIAAVLALELKPCFDVDEVWVALEATQEAYDALSRHAVPSLRPVRDHRQALKRAKKGGVLGGVELHSIASAMVAMRQFKAFLTPLREECPRLWPYAEALPETKRLEDSVLDSLDGDGSVKDGASATLTSIRQRKRSISGRILETIQSYITGRTRELLSDPIYTTRDGRYVIPLKAENRGKIRGIVHDTSGSGQTIYIEPEDVLQLGNSLREAEASEREEEMRILGVLSSKVGGVASETIGGIEACSEIDLRFARARLGFEMKAVAPQRWQGSAALAVHGGRHPLLDADKVVPLDIQVGKEKSVLITGPNTGGKTVAIKCVGLFVLMAQSGLFLPALDVKFAPFSQVWADIGDEQSLEQSLSTFSGHVKNIAEALANLKPGALVLLDEVGAGTDPAEGAALAIAILKEMSRREAVILASTHYGELKAFAYNTEGFTNAAMEFDAKSLRPTYRLLMGAPGASQALRIAERYGIPGPILESAREGLGQQQLDMASLMERLDQAQKQARIAQGDADRRVAELRKLEKEAKQKLKEADEIRLNANARAQTAIEGALREIRIEAANLFETLKRTPADPRNQDRVRRGLNELDEVGTAFAKEFAPKKKVPSGPVPVIEKGMSVKVDGFSQIGTVVDDPRGNSVAVQMGPIRMAVRIANLTVVSAPVVGDRPKNNIRLQKTINATTEIDMRHLRAEEAKIQLDRFLDDAVLAGLLSVRIVHGKGEGILRKMTQDVLKSHGGVSNFRDGEPAEGGQGVTIAVLA